ncbi:MAG: HAD-IA family hydrolase [Kangiellaceae bacterium]|nr:HAD-IA family hydrolase [Kangiellaceae bacterium]
MTYTKIKFLSFDLDNTLYDNQPVIELAEQKCKEFLQLQFTNQRIKFDFQTFLELRKKTIRIAKSNHEQKQIENLSRLRREVLIEFCQDLEESTQTAEQALKIFLKYRSKVNLVTPILSMMKTLSTDFKMVSITNGNCDPSLTALAVFFVKNYSPVDDFRAKPNPEMLIKVMDEFSLKPENILHIGDSVSSDGEAAKRAGCQYLHFSPFENEGVIAAHCDHLLVQLRK